MIHLKNLLNKIRLHPLTILYFITSYFTGYLCNYLIIYTIVCFHELCHYIMAYSFHYDIKKIELLPFGMYLSLDDYGFKPKMIDSIVILGGLCSHFFIYIINDIFFNNEFVSFVNKTVFSFNLLPIYPLDGYRLMLIILESIFDIKKSNHIMMKLSFFNLCVLFVFCNSIGNYVLFGYIFYMNIYNYYTIDKYLRRYYLSIPYTYNNKKKKVHLKEEYLRDYDNYYMKNNKIYSAQQMKFELIKSIKRIEN